MEPPGSIFFGDSAARRRPSRRRYHLAALNLQHASTRSLPQAWLAIGLAGALWAVPLLYNAIPTRLGPHDVARIAQLVLLLAGAAIWALSPTGFSTSPIQQTPESRARPSWTSVALATLGLLILASCLTAVHPLIAVREVLLLGSVLLLARPLALALSDHAIRDRFLDVITVGAAIHGSIWAALLVAACFSSEPFTPWELVFGFDNPRFLNHAQTIALPLIGVVLMRQGGSRWIRAAAAIALITAGALLSLYVARATTLGLLVGATVTACVLGRPAWRYVAGTGAALGAGALAMGLAWTLWLRHLTVPMIDNVLHTHRRNVLVDQAVDLFLGSPWLGVGPMHFAQTVNPVAAHPHNVYLQLLSECGAPACALIVVLGVVFLRRRFADLRRVASSNTALAGALLAATVAMLVDSAFSGNWVMPISQLWIAVLIALLLGLRPGDVQRAPRTRTGRAARLVVLMAIVVATGQAFIEAADDVPHVHTGEAMKMSIGRAALTPRFWSHGWF